MTLILIAIHKNYIVQVSDRLITANERALDNFSNKIIVYRARDAIVTLGYTGIAIIQGRPTDEWLAEKMFGEPIKSNMLMQLRKRPNRMDLGLAMFRLRYELEQIIAKMSRQKVEHELKITVCGWQGSRNYSGQS